MKENQTNQQQKATEENRRLQFNKEIEVLTLLKRYEQSKTRQQPGSSSKASREEIQSTAQRYDKKFQD